MSTDGARNQDRLCWRGPAASYWTGPGLQASTLVMNYGATKVVSTQKDHPSFRRRGDPISEHIRGTGMNVSLFMNPEGNRSQQ
jgi:hypothetical protein